MSELKTVEVKPEQPAGWWNLKDIKGTHDAVIRHIEARADIPPHWRASLKAQLKSAPEGMNHVEIDAHFTCHGPHEHYSQHVKHSKVLI